MTVIDKGPHECGETPQWDRRSNRLYWVDASNHLLFSRDMNSGTVKPYDTGLPVTAVRLDEQGSFTLLSKYGLHIWNPESEEVTENCNFLNENEPLRFNDGIPLKNGDFIAGAFDESNLTNGEGCLYRLNRNGTCMQLDSKLHVPNGVAVSPDGKTLYMSEMYKNRILAYNISEEKKERPPREVFLNLPEDQGKPDGLLCDKNGNLWVAHWLGSRLSCYTPEGSLVRTVDMPCKSPTCPCFSDEKETGMFVTSATLELSDKDLKNYPFQGGVFKIDL